MILLISLATLILCPISQASATCIWYGQTHQEGSHWKNKVYNGEALPLNNNEAEEIFKRRCPTLYKEYKGEDGQGIQNKLKLIFFKYKTKTLTNYYL